MEAAIQTLVGVFLKSAKGKESLGPKDFKGLVQSQLSNIMTDTDSEEAVKNMGQGLDANNDGKVGFEEYLKLVGYLATTLSEQRSSAKEEPAQNSTSEQVAQTTLDKEEEKPEANTEAKDEAKPEANAEAKEEAKPEANEEAKAEATAEVKIEANADDKKVEAKAEGETQPEAAKEEEKPEAEVAAAVEVVEEIVKEAEKVEETEKVEEATKKEAAPTEEDGEKKTEEATS